MSGSGGHADIELDGKQLVEFVIAKASGFNTGSLYTAGGYHDIIDEAIESELPKGHYYVVGAGGRTFQAAHYVNTLYRYEKDHDVLALDNEPLDSNPAFWTDAECAEWFTLVHLFTGHPYDRMWLYMPAALSRQHGPWPQIQALGVRVWWVSWGDNDAEREEGEEPFLGGVVDDWDVHQYTSFHRIPEYDRRVDGNYAKHSVATLFDL